MATSDPPVATALKDALKDLFNEEITDFKLHLRHTTLFEEERKFEVIRRGKLENKSRAEIVEVMLDTYGIFTFEVVKKVLRTMGKNNEANELWELPYDPEEILKACNDNMKSELRERFEFLSEGVSSRTQMEFNDAYTELFITEGDSGRVNEEHEVRQMERYSRRSGQEKTVHCQDIFKDTDQRGKPIRAVLTKGVAGAGKTVLTQKFSLDWAEGRENQDVELLLYVTFRELNELRGFKFSLVELLHFCFSETKDLFSFNGLQLLFIFDGLDECRPSLDFRRTRVLTDPTESASMEELLVNLIRGNLLPSARLWITTRPAAANQIPAKRVSMVTEVRGFTDPQKEQYFWNRSTDKATAIISHIKKSRSLFIMCHLPVICWIISDVLLHLMETEKTEDLPTTLTEMYVHFLVVQVKVTNIKYHEGTGADEETRKMVKSLGKLAFEQLLKGNLIFSQKDLRECGLDSEEIGQSGVLTQVFREQPGQGLKNVYCFIHLTVQEFLAALHVHETFYSSGENLLSTPRSSESPKTFYRSAVDQALQSPNGHLDLFLRFLLGLSLPTNQRLLENLLTVTGSERTNQRTAEYLEEKLDEKCVSAERRLNLMHCLNELNNRSLVEEIQEVMREGRLSHRHMSPALWSALSFLLLSSDSDLDEFDLRKYRPTEQGLLGLLPVVKASTKVTLSDCDLTSDCCGPDGPLASVLSSSSLTLLDLSNNDLQDSGVELLCEGLKSAPCRLQTLSLSLCGLTSRCCGPLALVFSSSSLTLLDLSNNDLQDSGVELLCEGLKSAPCRLDTLRLSGCGLTQRGGSVLVSALESQPTGLTVLDLSENPLTDEGVKGLCVFLRSKRCQLQTLRLSGCGLTQRGGSVLVSALESQPSGLTVLDLSENPLKDEGMKRLCGFLWSKRSRLQTLSLKSCGLSDRSCHDLVSALKSDKTLKELDLRNNNVTSVGVKQLRDFQTGPGHRRIRLPSSLDPEDKLDKPTSMFPVHDVTQVPPKKQKTEQLVGGVSQSSAAKDTDSADTIPIPDPRTFAVADLQSVRSRFVNSVSDPILNQLLDSLVEGKYLIQEEMDKANVIKVVQDKARYVLDNVIKKGPKPADFLIKKYCELDPQSELCEDLQRLKKSRDVATGQSH